jgi:ribulose-phosphate 3-epimerase
MVERPETWVRPMCDAGADMIVFHLESALDPFEVVERVRAEERLAGIALKHETPIDAMPDDLLASVDLINLVAVPLGYGGSASVADIFEKIVDLRERIDGGGLNVAIEVDGGVKPSNAVRYVEAGADMLTVGTGIYHSDDVEEAVRTLRDSTRGPADERARGRLERFLSVPSSEPVDDAGRRERLEALRAALDIPKNVWDPTSSAS